MFVDVMSRLVAGARKSPFRTGVLLVLWLMTHGSAAAAQSSATAQSDKPPVPPPVAFEKSQSAEPVFSGGGQ